MKKNLTEMGANLPKFDLKKVEAEILLADLIDEAYLEDMQSITYPCPDGTSFTLEIPKRLGLDAVLMAKRSNEYQRAYSIKMVDWATMGKASVIVTSRFGETIYLFCVTTGDSCGVMNVITKRQAELLRHLDIGWLARIGKKKAGRDLSNVVVLPLQTAR